MIIAWLNKRKNRLVPINNNDYQNGQGVGELPKLRYGLCSAEHNGCESIAVYNALLYLKKPQPLFEVMNFMERYRMCLGFFGGNPHKLLKHPAFRGTNSRKIKNFAELDSAEAFIISYWCEKPFRSSLHSIFCARRKDKRIAVYNRCNSAAGVREFSSIDEIIRGGKIITAYIIED